MPTLVSNTPRKQLHVRKTTPTNSHVESTWNTHSMSPTSNREEVSWSSSDGSTYYSEGKPSLQKESSEESTDYSEDEVSLQERRKTYRVSQRKKHDRSVSYSARSYDANTDYQRSKNREETTPRSKDFVPRKDRRVLPVTTRRGKKKLLLKNVESFPAIEVATGSEGVSAVGFLTTEDTAEVFCKAGIPFEITANKKLYEKISAISSSSTCGSSAGSSYTSGSESDEGSRRHQDKRVKHTATDTERATIRSQTSEVSSCVESSVPTIDRHAVSLVSVSYQDPVSSLECASTYDDLSLGSDTSESSFMEKPRRQERRNSPIRGRKVARSPQKERSPIRTREAVMSPQTESTVSRIEEIKRKKSDLNTDERIKQLKAKIKRISDLSNTAITVSSSEVESHFSSNLQSHAMQTRKSVESHLSYSQSHAMQTRKSLESHLSYSQSHAMQTRKSLERQYNVEEGNLDTAGPIMNRFESRDSQQRNNPIPTQNDYRRSFEGEKSLVGMRIPVVEREEISILRFDTSARPLGEGDIEGGPRRSLKSEKRTSRPSLIELRTSISEHTKILVTGVQYRAIAAYDHVVPIIARKRAEFLRKPRYEQVLIISIGALSSLFLILLFVMIAQ